MKTLLWTITNPPTVVVQRDDDLDRYGRVDVFGNSFKAPAYPEHLKEAVDPKSLSDGEEIKKSWGLK